ncbi:MAG: hypothetical protein ACD_72C00396G0006 [uncultured bacterium]|uniref:RiboL-PSP-HEPN domain-containing protein n=1 Tax=Candidatus Magasanikbacteria bacterium RIFOXYD2_FULL_36_9 TaxID=1798707 RepID=A0A1F6P0I5_9BACT|nr:MAG: hypothetical protein ACD_72C00396G0006 [uncultured bacterium]OGH89641.1 MAG: hypothetical protein A2537_00555 [Candidatus Magasanikbacteria bacterium RIFOXYD2_FULL_36_9]
MQIDINNFQPFQHDKQESKNQLINFARTQDVSKVEGVFTATLIYTNLVDYLAKHLLENLRKMVCIDTYKRFGGVFYYDPNNQRINLSLGELCNNLDHFDFPDKKDLMENLRKFSKLRNQIMHNLMQLDLTNNAAQFEQDLKNVSALAEEVLLKYNIIVRGVTTVWQVANNPQQ